MPTIDNSQASRELGNAIRNPAIRGRVCADGKVDQVRSSFFGKRVHFFEPGERESIWKRAFDAAFTLDRIEGAGDALLSVSSFFGKLVRFLKPGERESTWKRAFDALSEINPHVSRSDVQEALKDVRAKAGSWEDITLDRLREADDALQRGVAEQQKRMGGLISMRQANEAAVRRAATIVTAIVEAAEAVDVLRNSARGANAAARSLDNAYQAACEAALQAKSATKDIAAAGNPLRPDAAFQDFVLIADEALKSLDTAINAAKLAGVDDSRITRARARVSAAKTTCDAGSASDVASAARIAERRARDEVAATQAATGDAVHDARLAQAAFYAAVGTAAVGRDLRASPTGVDCDTLPASLVRDRRFVRAVRVAHETARTASTTTHNVTSAQNAAKRKAEIAKRVADAIRADIGARENPNADALYQDLYMSHARLRAQALGRRLSEGEQTDLANEITDYVREMPPPDPDASTDVAKTADRAEWDKVNLAHQLAVGLAEKDRNGRSRLVSNLTALVSSAVNTAENAALRHGVNLTEEPEVAMRSLSLSIERAMAGLTEKEAIKLFTVAMDYDGGGKALLSAAAAELADRTGVKDLRDVKVSPESILYHATRYILRALGKRGGYTDGYIEKRLNPAIRSGAWHGLPIGEPPALKTWLRESLPSIRNNFEAKAEDKPITVARMRIHECAASFVNTEDDFIALLRRYGLDVTNLSEIQDFVRKLAAESVWKMPASRLNSLEGEDAAQREADRLVAMVVRTRGGEIGRIATALPKQVREDLRKAVDAQVTRDKVVRVLGDREFGARLYAGVPNEEALGKIRALLVDRIVRSLEARGEVQQGGAGNIDDALIHETVRAVVPVDPRGLMAELNNHAATKEAYLNWGPSNSDVFRILSKIEFPDRALSDGQKSYYDHLMKEYVAFRGDELCAEQAAPHDVARNVLRYVSKLVNPKRRLSELGRAPERAVAFAKLLSEKAPRNASSSVDAYQMLSAACNMYAQDVTLSQDSSAGVAARNAMLVDLAKRLPLSSQLKGPETLFNDALTEGSAARQILTLKDIEHVYRRRGGAGREHLYALNVAAGTARFLAVIGMRAGLTSEEIKGRLLQAGASEEAVKDLG